MVRIWLIVEMILTWTGVLSIGLVRMADRNEYEKKPLEIIRQGERK